MKLQIFLALALTLGANALAAQSLDETLHDDAAAQSSEPAPPDTSETVPMSAFEAIAGAQREGSADESATPRPVHLKLATSLTAGPPEPVAEAPVLAPRIPGKSPEEPRPAAPSDWR